MFGLKKKETGSKRMMPLIFPMLASFIANKKLALFESINSIRETDRFKGTRGGYKCGAPNWSNSSKAYRKKKRKLQQAARKEQRA